MPAVEPGERGPRDPGPAERGLTAAELAGAVRELVPRCAGAAVLDVVLLGDDLLLVLEPPADTRKEFLHVALGSRRARVTLTARRFGRDARDTGPRADAMRRQLANARLADVDVPPGERRCTLRFLADGDAGTGSSAGTGAASGADELLLHVELFSARGLWVLCDAAGVVRELSRPVQTAVRTLRPGDRYAPPPAGAPAAEPPPRFQPPVLAAIDDAFTARDLAAEAAAQRAAWQRAADRALRQATQKCAGLRQQLQEAAQVDAVRAEADLMLAYAHAVPRGAAAMTVPDPLRDGAERTIELDPSKPVHVQAQARYDRARRLDEGRAIAAARLADAERAAAALSEAVQRLAGDGPLDPAEAESVRALLAAHGALPKTATPSREPAGRPKAKRPSRETKSLGPKVRRFRSLEGYEVLVGRDNAQNDALSTRIAKGNDVWLHVGGGRAGSHVVVRLPKGKTASLETLLDAGTLALHFSKARGERIVPVIYTSAKHVRKPKGLPPGAVVPSHTKTLTVRLDEERLRRLLASGDADA